MTTPTTTKTPKPDPTFWGGEGDERLEHEDRDDYIESHLDYCLDFSRLEEWPETITVVGFVKEEIDPKRWGKNILNGLLEDLDVNYSDPDGDGTTQTQAMQVAAMAFVEAVVAEYDVWSCQEVCREEVDVLEWIKEHRPDWLKEVKELRPDWTEGEERA